MANKTLEQYLRDASVDNTIDFRIRATAYTSAPTSFYIHPQGKDGETLDFTVIGNALVSNGGGGLDFGAAIAAMKQGKRVARAGWNGKGMWLALTPGSAIPADLARSGACKAQVEAEGVSEVVILPHIDMRAADGSIVIGWLASQTDMLAEDWCVVG